MICRFFIILNFLLSTKFLIAQANSKSGVFLNAGTGGYEEIVVIVGDELPRSSCPHILDSIKRSLTAASRSIYTATEGRAYLDKIAIEVPFSWAEVDCRTPLSTACLPPSNPRTGDFIIGEDHPIHGTFPFTQQYQGCGKPGEYVYLPYSFISSQNTSSQQGQRQSTAGQLIANQWARLRYGVFADLQDFTSGSSTINVASQQHAHCRAKSVHDVIYSHADFMQGGGGGHLLQAVNFTVPRFSLLRQAAPKYMIVLENSQTMNMEDNWSRIRTATKKFIVHDLPDVARVGLVLFNEAAHEGYPVSELRVESREGMAYSIGNKYDLSPSRSSCVRCGIEQAVQGLQESGVGAQGAVLIIISQGSISSFSLGDEKDMLDVAKRHSLQIYSISLPQLPVVDVNLSLERLAHSTGGESFYLSGDEGADSSLATYVKLMDTFREIQARTWTDAPQLIHEAKFSGHSEGVYENRGHFTIDKYTGSNTQFMVIAQNPSENYLKSISVQDQRGNMYSKIMDNMANFHIFSVYKVPFQSDQNIGMNWSYSLERLPSSDLSNNHFVEVISYPRDALDNINIRIWSNLDSHAVRLTGSSPVILYTEITVGRAPVLDASVTAEIQAINQSGYLSPKSYTTLLDNGNGDPDLVRQDGVYSRYLTGLPVEGRYTVRLIVTDNHGKAFAPLKVYGEPTRSCCLDVPAKISNQKMGAFTRIKMGDSFRVHNVVQDGEYPPARILDLSVKAITKTEELEFTWTSPGEDFDIGKPTSNQLFFAKNPQAFYSGKNRVEVLESFSASKPAGGREVRRSRIPALDKTIYYAILAVDQHGHLGEMSNIVKSLVQGRLASRNELKTGARHSAASAASSLADDVSAFINGGTLLDVEKPSTILFYLIAGIVGFIVLCGFIIMIILLSFRHRRKKEPTSIDEEDLESNGSGGGFNGGSLEAPLQGTSGLEIGVMDPETKHFLLGNSAQDSLLVGPTHSSLIKDDSSGDSVMENPYGYSAGGAGFQNFQNSQMAVSSANSFGWSATSNPYVYKDQNETYATIGGSFNNTSQDSYIRNTQPTIYARAIPKNMRNNTLNQGQHIYSNAAMIAARSSPHGSHLMAAGSMMAARSSPNGSQNSIASSRGTVTFQTQAETSLASPDPDSSDQAPTPTKSILKKPRTHHNNQTPRDNLTDTMSDRDSQCSQQSHSSSRNLYPSYPSNL